MKTKKIKKLNIKNENGVVAVIVAICLFAMMVAAALAIDVGSLFEDRRMLYTVADSAALAGAQELPEHPDEAEQKAIEYISFNYDEGVEIDIEIGSYLGVDNALITVTVLNPDSPLYFARVMGKESTPVVARATAIVASPEAIGGGMPWGVPLSDWEAGEEYVLKWGSGPSGEGGLPAANFLPLALDAPGANEYRQNIIEGASSYLEVGMFVDTQTGNVVGPTGQGTQTRIDPPIGNGMDEFLTLVNNTSSDPANPFYRLAQPDTQFVMIPIIPPIEELGELHGHSLVEIVRFVPFIITGIHYMSEDPIYGNGIAITGTFLDSALIQMSGALVPVDPGGIRIIRLIE
jgi:hypothetical protein